VSGAPFTITVTWSAGGSGIGFTANAIEVGGVPNGLGIDRVVTVIGNSATPSSGATAALIASEVFVVAAHTIGNLQSTITVESVSPPWIQEAEQLSGSNQPGETDSRILTGVAGTTTSVSWVDAPNSSNWAVVLVAFSAFTTPPATARVTQDAIETLTQPKPAARVSHDVVELISQPHPVARITHDVIEILAASVGSGPAAQAVTGATCASTVTLFAPTLTTRWVTGATCPATSTLFAPTVVLAAGVRTTQLALEVYLPLTIPTRITQVAVEAYRSPLSPVRLSQELVELWIVVPPCTLGSADFPIDPEPARRHRRR
jgi:hypothetical protein